MTRTHLIDPTVLRDARRILEQATRRLRQIEQDPADSRDRNLQRLSEARHLLNAADARLKD